MTFSTEVKNELLQSFMETVEDRHVLLGLAIIFAGRVHGNSLKFSTAHRAMAEVMLDCLDEEIGIRARLNRGKELDILTIDNVDDLEILRRFLKEDFDFDQNKGLLGDEWITVDGDNMPGEDGLVPRHVRTVQAAFLAGGSIAEPARAYHLEISVRRLPTAAQIMGVMDSSAIPLGIIKRYGYNILYLKDGGSVGDFLALAGAHISRLKYEECRMERELRNRVNRLVNCDSANTRRLAEASARQLYSLRILKESKEWRQLSDDLRVTAELRLEHPDLSLRELGQIMTPPLGKSGINHRLKRLQDIGDRLLDELRNDIKVDDEYK